MDSLAAEQSAYRDEAQAVARAVDGQIYGLEQEFFTPTFKVNSPSEQEESIHIIQHFEQLLRVWTNCSRHHPLVIYLHRLIPLTNAGLLQGVKQTGGPSYWTY